MTALLTLLGVVLAIGGILVSLGLHEYGHLVPAKLFGAKVTEYFFGFGKTLFSFRRGETEYGFKPVPLGAYVKIIGVVPPGPQHSGDDGEDGDAGGRRVSDRSTGMFAQLAEDARAAEWRDIEPEDEPRLFYKLAWWKKAIVYVGGVSMNLVLSAICFGIAFMAIGVPQVSTSVGSVSRCVVEASAAQQHAPRCTAKDPVSPAFAAGVRPGDRVIGFNGHRISNWDQLQNLIRGNADRAARLTVVRHGHTRTLSTHTVVDLRPRLNDPSTSVRVGFMGLTPATRYVPQGPGFVAHQMASLTWSSLQAVGTLPVKLYHLTLAIAGQEKRDRNGPIGLVGIGRVSGEVTADQSFSLEDKASLLLTILGGFNLFLAVINLVPLPPFDGGSFFGYLYEGLRRGWDRVRGRTPQDRFFDVARLLPLTYVMVAFILVVFVVTNLADVVVPVSLQNN